MDQRLLDRHELFVGGTWVAPSATERSGLGRELGPEGLASYLEPRSIGLPVA